MPDPTLGSLIIDIAGKTLAPEERDILLHPAVGGVILFSRNYESRAQLSALCAQIRHSRDNKPVLIMVDQEGGRVQRFKHEFTPLPPLAHLGQLFERKGPRIIQDAGWLMAIELLSAGIDFSLAPVLDLHKGKSSVIGDRAFHSQPDKVSELAVFYMQGMAEAGMAATGKHFPGHGTVVADSHLTLPVDDRPLDAILSDDLIPFMHLIRANIPALMAAHIIYPNIDGKPVSFSDCWLKTILRTQLHFDGVIFSDDLNMVGANRGANCGDRVQEALVAGCDFALLCNNRVGVLEAIESLEKEPHVVAANKWRRLQGQFASASMSYQTLERWQRTRAFFAEHFFIE